MHNFSSKTLSSNMTTRRIRLLVEKKTPAKSDTWSILFLSEVRHLVEKNRPIVGLCFFRNKYQNILPGIGHYKNSSVYVYVITELYEVIICCYGDIVYHKQWLHFFKKKSRCRIIAVKCQIVIFFIENLQKYLKCTEKHSVKVQICIDTENKIMQSRELDGK